MKVLVAFDGSNSSIKALTAGIKLVKTLGGELKYVYVANIGDMHHHDLLGEAQFKETLESLREEGKDIKDLLNERGWRVIEIANLCLKDSGVKAQEIIRAGPPAEEIVNAAREEGADLLVLGVNSRQPVLSGDVVREVVENSPSSILAVAQNWATVIVK
ncbi:MAG: universal stress protein [Euryarchaeota archaeon]|nr:universal stress protein [Euryarchaeota archaeon]